MVCSTGYTSAVSIAHENGDDFVKKNEDITDGVDDAQTIYTAAVHTASQALFLMGTFNQQSDFDGESIPGVTEKLTPAPAIAPAPSLKNAVVAKMASQPILEAKSGQEDAPENGIRPVHPNIATLFGQQNQCLCPDCQSIFSPSAYLVDLLEFMGPETANVLFSRRPDLAETELSCRNTNGPVAYIDLVNEQLENAACTRTFFIQDNSNEDFAELLNQVLQSKLNIPQYVNEQFSIRGYRLIGIFIYSTKPEKTVGILWEMDGVIWLSKFLRSCHGVFSVLHPFLRLVKMLSCVEHCRSIPIAMLIY